MDWADSSIEFRSEPQIGFLSACGCGLNPLKTGFPLGESKICIRINSIEPSSATLSRLQFIKEGVMSASNPVLNSIKHSIQKNGFPGKTVRLPFKPVYDSCKKNDTALADVLSQLKGENILGSMEGDYIVFRSPEKAAEAAQSKKSAAQEEDSNDSSWWSKLPGIGDLPSMAKEAMAKMTPEQLAEIKKRVENMSDEEKQNILKMISQFKKPGK